MGIWGFEAAIDSSYPVALAGPVSWRPGGFVAFYRGILMGFGQRNCPELSFRLRIVSAIRAMSFALMAKVDKRSV
jgi:hypothetical protein